MAKKRWHWSEDMDRFLRKHYDPAAKGRSAWIARCLGIPRWAVNRRAIAQGLSRTKDSLWSAKDELYLEEYYHRKSIRTLAKRLGRSVTAVRLKAKRLGLRKNGEGYTALSLSQALGVDPHWVTQRISNGTLKATHRNTERTESQGGDSWLITDESVVTFIRDNPYDIDLRKVDALWFMDLICAWLKDPDNSASETSQPMCIVGGAKGDSAQGSVNSREAVA